MESTTREEDKTQLIHHTGVKVYKRRWYILMLFSMLALYNCTVWNTWGPVADTVQMVYPGWDDSTVSLLANWGPIAFLVFLLPTLYISEVNLRASIVLSSGLVFAGAGVRCIFLVYPTVPDSVFTALCHFGAVLNGITSIVVTSVPAAVSAAWFPPEERVTATSISQMLNNIGTAVSFLIATIMVPEPHDSHDNSTSSCHDTNVDGVKNLTLTATTELRTNIQHYLLVLSAPAAVIFACSIVYFPSKPPQPPSRSSAFQRLHFVSGVWRLVKTPAAWMIAIVWSVPQAIWNNWCAMMVVSLTKIGEDGGCLTEKWVNVLGIVAVCVGTAVAILVGMATDKIKGHMKPTIIALLTLGGIFFTFLSLISVEAIKLPTLLSLQVWVYVLLLLGNSMVVSTSPLCMEFAVEKLYPVPEGIVGGWLNIWYNIISVIFYCIFEIPGVGTSWLNYVLPLSCVAVLPLMFMLKEEYKRAELDAVDSDSDEEDDDEGGVLHEDPQV